MVNRRPKLELIAPAAAPAQAAAIVAALERFMRDTAPAPAPPGKTRDPWILAAMLEGVGRDDEAVMIWGDPDPWVWGEPHSWT